MICWKGVRKAKMWRNDVQIWICKRRIYCLKIVFLKWKLWWNNLRIFYYSNIAVIYYNFSILQPIYFIVINYKSLFFFIYSTIIFFCNISYILHFRRCIIFVRYFIYWIQLDILELRNLRIEDYIIRFLGWWILTHDILKFFCHIPKS